MWSRTAPVVHTGSSPIKYSGNTRMISSHVMIVCLPWRSFEVG
jgi:hypothetical protein